MKLTALRLMIIGMAIPFWIGVFSGYYSRHAPYSNLDPDMWIKSFLGPLSIGVMVDVWQQLRAH